MVVVLSCFCAGQVFDQMICPFAVAFLQAIFDVFILFSNPVLLCLFHALLDLSVDCSVLRCSFCIIFVLLLLQFPPFVTQIKDLSGDPWLLDWAMFSKDLIGCVGYCCVEGVSQRVKSMSLSSMERAANFPPIIAWKTSATCGSFSLSTSNLILACPCFLVLFKCSLKVIITSS